MDYLVFIESGDKVIMVPAQYYTIVSHQGIVQVQHVSEEYDYIGVTRLDCFDNILEAETRFEYLVASLIPESAASDDTEGVSNKVLSGLKLLDDIDKTYEDYLDDKNNEISGEKIKQRSEDTESGSLEDRNCKVCKGAGSVLNPDLDGTTPCLTCDGTGDKDGLPF